MFIITHRGLEPSNTNFFVESSYEAFENHLARGFGIEFDVQFLSDGIGIIHDTSLKRYTGDETPLSSYSLNEFLSLRVGSSGCRFTSLQELFELLEKSSAPLSALHLKGVHQTPEKIQLLIIELKKHPALLSKLVVFDLLPSTAVTLRKEIPLIQLAASVSHEYDIHRYGPVVHNTLLSISQILEYGAVYDWVWLDEWDTIDSLGSKQLYTKETFSIFRNAGMKIALVSPELHALSPDLYGGEVHSDASSSEKLFSRIRQIISLNPDVICTDFPEEVSRFIQK